MSRGQRLWRGLRGTLLSALLAGSVWELFARSGMFSGALTPSLVLVVEALARMTFDGSLAMHVGATLGRIAGGLVAAAALGVPVGMLMGRFWFAERFMVPIISVLSPIPSLAWVPVFILWFGLGNTSSIALVFYAATFPIMLNVWTGVRSVNRIWLRAAEAMGADHRRMLRLVVLPGALPFVIAGLRQAFARAWIAVVGGEMIAATSRGLGWVLFDAKEFLNTDIMIGTLIVIGILGLAVERVAFQALERRTVARWGMARRVGA